jgi:hypothetical protein
MENQSGGEWKYNLFHFLVVGCLSAATGGMLVGFGCWAFYDKIRWPPGRELFVFPNLTLMGTCGAVAIGTFAVSMMIATNKRT